MSLKSLITAVFLLVVYFPLWSQIDVELSFNQYQEEYQPLSNGDTIFGMENELWGNDFEVERQLIPLNSSLRVPGMDDWPFDEILIVTTGASGLISFNEETNEEVRMGFSPASTFYYCSPLLDPINTDQGYIILYQDSNYIVVDFQNIANTNELSLSTGNLTSRFNFQVEYRKSDSRVRFIYGPSEISQELEDFFWEDYLYCAFGYELSLFDEFGNWDDWLDVEFITLFGLAEDPFIIRSQDSEFWPTPFTLVDFPTIGTVYEFFTSPSTFISEIGEESLGFNVFPNPVSDILFIAGNEILESGTEYNFEVFNAKGKLEMKGNIVHRGHLDFSSLSAGAYFLRVSTNNLQSIYRIIKD